MSYDIVRGLQLKKDVKEVWIKAASSNVTPKSFYWEVLPGLSKMYKTDGEEAVIKTLLRIYWEGSFQAGTFNNYHRAMKVFKARHPHLQYWSIGEIKDWDLCTCPLEDLPKYLNIQGRQVKEIVKPRLNGDIVDPASIERPITMTKTELLDGLYDTFINYRKRKKGKFIYEDQGEYYYGAARGFRFYATPKREEAHVFTSWEDAVVQLSKYGFDLKNIKEEK